MTPESECPPPTQRSSAASPRTSLASGKLPTRRRAFPLCRQECYHCCRVRAGVPNIYSMFYLGTLDSVVYWVTSSVGHTIYLLTQLITLKSNTIRFNYPSDSNKHPHIHYKTIISVQMHNILYIPEIPIPHRISSTSLFKATRLNRQTVM